MKVQIIKNRFSKEQIEIDISFEQLKNILKNPLSKSKEECPLWRFCSVFNNKQNSRLQENYDEINSLLLDFDKAVSIREFKEKYSRFNYYLYTTTSHSKNQDKFRVIMPLKTSIKYSEVRRSEVLEALTQFFDNIDVTSFRNSHNLPNKPLNPSDYYYFYNNSSEFFDVDILKDDIKKIARKNELERKKNATRGLGKNYSSEMSDTARESYKRVVESKFEQEILDIPSYKTGKRYNDLCEFVGKMMIAKYPDHEYIFEKHEIENLVFLNCKDKNIKNMINNFWNKGR